MGTVCRCIFIDDKKLCKSILDMPGSVSYNIKSVTLNQTWYWYKCCNVSHHKLYQYEINGGPQN